MPAITPTRLQELLGTWRHGGAAGERLAATVRALVLDGRLPVQTRLPAERALAARLGVSRSTVTAAYDRLRSEGYISSRQGSGSFIGLPAGHRASSDAISPAGGIDLRVAALPAPAALAELATEAAGDLPRWLDHHGYEPLGIPDLRTAVAERFAERGLPTVPEQILITSGALQALNLVLSTVLPRGGQALVELPGYPAALEAIRAHGARIHGVPVRGEGWDLEVLEQVARQHRPALAYLTPDFQNPTTALLDEPGRRRAMRALAGADTYIVIDETFVELSLDQVSMPPPAARWAGRRGITVGSLSKAVWGGLRIGWIRAEVEIVQRLAAVRAHLDMASPVLEQLVATRIMASLPEFVDDRRELARRRRDALAAGLGRHLPEWGYTLPRGGLWIWAELPAPISTRLAVHAGEHGLMLTPGPRFGGDGLLERYLRLPFAAAPDELEQVARLLATTVSRLGETTAASVADGYTA